MSGLFPDFPGAVAELRNDHLNGPLFRGFAFSPTHLERQLASAEGDAERALRTFFGTVQVLPDDGDQETRSALDEAETRWVEDPGYDMEPGFFQGERWGFLVLRHRPAIAVQSFRFVYPQPNTTVWAVPPDWIRLDKHAGHINIVPGAQPFVMPLSAWVMSVMAGGRTIPRMLQLKYTAGIANPTRDYPELADVVLQMAALRVLKGLMLPGSGSISADGLSQSRNVAIKDYQDDIDARLERLRQAIHGVTLLCV